MSKTNLFGNHSAKNKNLVEFKAGKMTMDEKNWVYPDKRKGIAYIHQSNDGLTHFCWKERNSGSAEDDLIVFPEDTEFMRIHKCKTGRVFVLKFKNSKKFFLWLQEPKSDKDEEICKKVNDSLNSTFSTAKRLSNKRDMQELIASASNEYALSQSDLISILGMEPGLRDIANDSDVSSRNSSATGTRPLSSTKRDNEESSLTPATPIPETAAAPSNTSRGNTDNTKFKINDLRSILTNIQQTSQEKSPPIDLTDVINSNSVLSLLNKPENVSRLEPLLPEKNKSNKDSKDYVQENIQSPQMHAAVKSFGSAVQSGELAPVLSQFNLGENVNIAAQSGNLKQIATAMESSGATSSTLKNEKEEPMEISSKNTEESLQGDEVMDQD